MVSFACRVFSKVQLMSSPGSRWILAGCSVVDSGYGVVSVSSSHTRLVKAHNGGSVPSVTVTTLPPEAKLLNVKDLLTPAPSDSVVTIEKAPVAVSAGYGKSF